jgi:hypothetical protein
MKIKWKERALRAEDEYRLMETRYNLARDDRKSYEEFRNRERDRLARERDMYKVHAVALGRAFNMLLQEKD